VACRPLASMQAKLSGRAVPWRRYRKTLAAVAFARTDFSSRNSLRHIPSAGADTGRSPLHTGEVTSQF